MRFENWMAFKFIMANKNKMMFPFLAIAVSTAAIFLSLTIKMSIFETVQKDLRSIGKNTILIGGDYITDRDCRFIKSIPNVDYYFYADQFQKIDENLFKGYPKELLIKMKLPNLRKNDVILDSTQFKTEKIGDIITFYINSEKKEFLIRGFYKETNPLETMKVGKRVFMSEEGFKANILWTEYSRVVIAFKDNVESKDYTESILNNLNKYRNNKLSLLETPEIYKKMTHIIGFLDKTLLLLFLLSTGIGGFFVFNVTMSSIIEKRSSIGMLSAIGMSKKRIFRLFLIQNLYLLISGMFLGIAIGLFVVQILEKILKIEIVIYNTNLSIILLSTVVLGVILGVIPIKKIEKNSIIELLKVS
ncbi:ABC transporter permease [Cetobacterium sp.]|uniref:ABC transporter permease n=1 Tax=Cetobacterium sp. TaxID=2071632 RepID=UPI003F3D8198